jgi:hypothetical protein
VVVFGDAGAWLVGAAHHRIAHVRRDVDDRADLFDLPLVQPFRVHAVEAVRLDPAHAVADVLEAVGEVEDSALGEEDRVVQLLLQALPEFEGVFVDARALVPEVVGTDDRGVASHVAARQPTLLQHRDVGDAVVLRQVVGGGQAVAAAAHDYYVVRAFRLGCAPEPVGVFGEVCARGAGGHRGASSSDRCG